jgi:hypothetical protein
MTMLPKIIKTIKIKLLNNIIEKEFKDNFLNYNCREDDSFC